MADDIVKNMRLRPDYSDLPVPDWSPQQIAGGLEKGVGLAYEMARTPLTSSEDIARQFQEMRSQPDYTRAMTAQPTGPTTIRQARPGEEVQSPAQKFARFGENVIGMAGDIAPVALGAGMVRDDIVRQMKPAVKGTSKHMKKWFGPQSLSYKNADNYVNMLKQRGFTADSHKRLMKFVKKFHNEAPEDFVDFLSHIQVHGQPGDMSVRKGVGAFYQPGSQSIHLPATTRPETAGHEVSHALWDWVRKRYAQEPGKYPKLKSFISRAEWKSPTMRAEWFNMAEEMESMQRKGLINFEEHLAAYKKFQSFYKKGIPEEMMANTFSRGWLDEGLSMDEALKRSMKVGGRLLEKQKSYRNAMRKEFQAWRKGLEKVRMADIEAEDLSVRLAIGEAESQLRQFGMGGK
jgi:hypothetical protein